MSQNEPARRPRIPRSKAGKILLNLVITAILGAIYFYVSLPALNFQSSDFYVFIGLLCVIYFICALVTSGFHMENSGPREYFTFIKKQCLPVGVIFAAIIVIGLVGSILSAPIFRAGAYRELLDVEILPPTSPKSPLMRSRCWTRTRPNGLAPLRWAPCRIW